MIKNCDTIFRHYSVNAYDMFQSVSLCDVENIHPSLEFSLAIHSAVLMFFWLQEEDASNFTEQESAVNDQSEQPKVIIP